MGKREKVISNFLWRLLERFGAQGVTLIISIVLAILQPFFTFLAKFLPIVQEKSDFDLPYLDCNTTNEKTQAEILALTVRFQSFAETIPPDKKYFYFFWKSY